MAMGNDVAEEVSAKSSDAVESTYSYGGTTYKVWTYRSGGTFVVPRDIEVDVVVVGGGGGGGFNVGGGGGAGVDARRGDPSLEHMSSEYSLFHK